MNHVPTPLRGKISVVGLGPGGEGGMTGEAAAAIAAARHVFGYGPYLDRLSLGPDQRAHPSDNREELARAGAALTLAEADQNVVIVTAGDPGVFAMAAAVCEAIEHGPADWRELEVTMVPGVTALLAVAARFGAPLGHDFCALSLSDNLKPWEVIEARLAAAAGAGFVVALYNPISKARPWQFGRALELLSGILPATTPIMFGRAIGRADEAMILAELKDARPEMADMSTCVIVGSAETRLVPRPERTPLVYTPRSFGKVSA